MRHRVYGKKLGRTKNQRTALFKSLVRGLILSGSIETTESKAKAVKGLVDKIISQAKSPNTRRLVSQFISDKAIADKLINEIVPRLSDRSSGFTSIIKIGSRQGDRAMVVRMSLLVNEKLEKKEKVVKKSPAKKEVIRPSKGGKKS